MMVSRVARKSQVPRMNGEGKLVVVVGSNTVMDIEACAMSLAVRASLVVG